VKYKCDDRFLSAVSAIAGIPKKIVNCLDPQTSFNAKPHARITETS